MKNVAKKLGAVFLVLTLSGIGAIVFLLNAYQLSLTELLNKVAVKFSLTNGEGPLIPYQQRYRDNVVTQPDNLQYPRIFLRQLRQWDGLTTPFFYGERTDNLKSERLGFNGKCNNKSKPEISLHCFLTIPVRDNLRTLERQLIDYKLAAPKVQGSYGNGWKFAMLYDIAKASPDFSATASAAINRKIADILASYLAQLDGESASLWHGRSSLAASAFLLASVLEVNTPGYQMLYQRAYGHFDDFYQAIAATEIWPEGYNYWINSRALPVVMALSAFKELQPDLRNADKILVIIKRIGLWHIYLTRPDFKIEGWADEGPRTDLKDESARVIDLIAQITDYAPFFEFAKLIRKHHGAASYYSGYRWMLPLLYASDKSSAVNSLNTAESSMDVLASELATSELFGANYTNHLNIRSDWTDNGTFITFRAGHSFTHHQHYDAGHFSIYKGAPLAVSASRYNGNINGDNRKNFAIRTIAKNSLLIQKTGEVVKPNRLFNENVAAGGQRLVMPTGSAVVSFDDWQQQLYQGRHVEGAQLVNYRYQPSLYTAITSDLTAAYNSNRFDINGDNGKVRRVERTLVYLMQQDMVLVYDTLQTIKPAYKTKWLLHTINRPKLVSTQLLKGTMKSGIFSAAGSVIEIENGDSTMRLDILAPVNAKTMVVGGDNYRYYVESDGDDSVLDGRNFDGGAKESPWYDLPQWRLEISPQSQSSDTHYLIAMQPRIVAENTKVRIPQTVAGNGVNATIFDKLLVLSGFTQQHSQLVLTGEVSTLAVFADKAAAFRIDKKNSVQYDLFKLEPGFNYIKLPNAISGAITMEFVAEF